jgi:hypothetical protein
MGAPTWIAESLFGQLIVPSTVVISIYIMSGVDPAIVLIFGPPPAGIDLSDSLTVAYDVVSCVVLGIAAAAVCLRFYVRTMRGANSLAIDDYFVVLGLVSPTRPLVAMNSLCIPCHIFYSSHKKMNELSLTIGFNSSALVLSLLRRLLVGTPIF